MPQGTLKSQDDREADQSHAEDFTHYQLEPRHTGTLLPAECLLENSGVQSSQRLKNRGEGFLKTRLRQICRGGVQPDRLPGLEEQVFAALTQEGAPELKAGRQTSQRAATYLI